MRKINNNDLLELAQLIVENIKLEFEKEYLSGNLVKTMYLENDENGIHIRIPAPRYNMKRFIEKGEIVYNNRGSYASELDIRGSVYWLYKKRYASGEHKDYVDRAIDKALEVWTENHGLFIDEL